MSRSCTWDEPNSVKFLARSCLVPHFSTAAMSGTLDHKTGTKVHSACFSHKV